MLIYYGEGSSTWQIKYSFWSLVRENTSDVGLSRTDIYCSSVPSARVTLGLDQSGVRSTVVSPSDLIGQSVFLMLRNIITGPS